MILLIEPQCQGFAHEQFNSALLFGYSLAYSDEEIIFFAEQNHINCVRYVLSSNNLFLNKIKFSAIEIPESNLLSKPRVVFKYRKIIDNLLNFALKNDCKKIVFSSIYSFNLISLKYLLLLKYKDIFCFHLPMHSTIEFIKRNNSSFFQKIVKTIEGGFKKLSVNDSVQIKNIPFNNYLYEKLFKFSIKLFSNKNITYYVLREDSLQAIKRYLPKHFQFFKSIDHPCIFRNYSGNIQMQFPYKIIFATLGQGNIIALKELVYKLSLINISPKSIEIRIIGGGYFNKLEDFEAIKVISNNKRLSRAEIEEQIKEVNYVLFMYEADSYELSTSGFFF